MKSKLTELHDLVLEMARKTNKETTEGRNTEYMTALSEATQRLASAYQIMRETELHEMFHMGEQPEDEFSLPGEGPLKSTN